MAFIMKIYTDGGCRDNGQPGARAAAACGFKTIWGKFWRPRTKVLPLNPTPTNQRAEITAIILALEEALIKYEALHGNPYLKATIHSDSKYAIGCMTEWLPKWVRTGWITSLGDPVANQDLIQEASALHDQLKGKGRVRYVWIPREKNEYADRKCNDALDKL
ncbi:hypothetical protein N7456_009332 [Penicillium angulare]|uniref:ribonuclease H n=1 Tax=Penicillium angulare TaxID=116970 RepID=A0A9W9F4K7_9EURO|nr:hypothetical protein N7456_009332 [Penicillium angulare]